ncbi:response regulator [Colwellia sp. UCD-KL20]|uniref:phosphorylase family protein n=1 Tax=Colwellia sp. UCD-KL20 TaxID=1917165 RepID=UPI0009714286|nr:response regulator [Colwellia sp. UCD-KL20]
MVNILIVEDDSNKLRRIIQEIVKIDGVEEDNIFDVSDVKSAKKLLQQQKFELLLLDINLPKTKSSAEITKLSGLDILRFIQTNIKAIPPNHIIGMTADTSIFEEAKEGFSSLIWNVIKFEYSDDSWISPLQSSIKYLVTNDVPPFKNDGKTYHVEVGLVCALKEELDAVLNLGMKWEAVEVKHDHTRYYKSKVSMSGNDITLIATSAPKMGMNSSAVIAQKLISSFHPRILMMTGICAGVRGKTDIGDVLVADPCFEWGGGKWVSDGANGLIFKTAPYQWRVNESIRALLSEISDDSVFFDDVYKQYDDNRPGNRPKLIVDAMASGSSVLQSSEMVENIVRQHKNLIGLEMESYAIYTAAALCEDPRPLCVSIKSVCDFGDETKADGYHHYAAYTSARVFEMFINRWFS